MSSRGTFRGPSAWGGGGPGSGSGSLPLGRVTFSNADYTIDPTDSYVAQVGTMSAVRTATLPAANAVAAGHEITVVDESKTITDTKYITIARASSDTITNYADFSRTTSAIIRHPGSAMMLRSDGTSKWTVIEAGHNVPAAWFWGTGTIAIPDSVWTPIPWTLTTDPYKVGGVAQPTAATTIASGSNGAVLPQATINVASTTGFTSSGFFTINGPPGASVLTIVSYTGVTATSFTGCNTSRLGTGVGISTGTMATSQVVAQVVCDYVPATPGYYMSIADIAFASNSTGYRGVRFRGTTGFMLVGAAQHAPGLAITAGQHVQCMMQPAPLTTEGTIVEVYQTSGGVLNCPLDGIAAPSLMQVFMSGVAR